MTQNEVVYAIGCRPEVAGDVISGGNVRPKEGYAVLNFLKLLALGVSQKIIISRLCNA